MPVAGQTQGSQQLQEGVYAIYDNQNSVAGFTMPQHASHSLETSVHHASPHHFIEHVSAAQQQPGQIYHQPTLPSAFGVQGLHHNVYGHQMQPSHDSGYPVDSSFGQVIHFSSVFHFCFSFVRLALAQNFLFLHKFYLDQIKKFFDWTRFRVTEHYVWFAVFQYFFLDCTPCFCCFVR